MEETNWGKIQEHLQNETIKPKVYDSTLLKIIGEVFRKKILDYGSGPAVIAQKFQLLGAIVKTFDTDSKMTTICKNKIGYENVFDSIKEIPQNYFDIVTCNLVLCINDDERIPQIITNISKMLTDNGKAYIGFCNPKILNIHETQLDFRPKEKRPYNVNHFYQKIKKEGDYPLVDENHRPIEWYKRIFVKNGLKIINIHFTPEYKFKGNKIQDFIIFELEVLK